LIKQSTHDATTAAKAATASANAVVENQRPFVGPVTTSTANKKLAIGSGYRRYYVVIFNSGRSPAQRMKVLFKGEIRPTEWTPRFMPDPSHEPSKTLFPGVTDFYYAFTDQPDLSQGQFDRIVAGTDRMWIFGRIEYLDNRDRRQHTNLCTVYNVQREAFVPHTEHNDAS